jgi:hypothetical protein
MKDEKQKARNRAKSAAPKRNLKSATIRMKNIKENNKEKEEIDNKFKKKEENKDKKEKIEEKKEFKIIEENKIKKEDENKSDKNSEIKKNISITKKITKAKRPNV